MFIFGPKNADNKRNHQLNYPPPEVTDAERNLKDYAHRKSSFRKRQCFEINPSFYLTGIFWVSQLQAVFWTQSLSRLMIEVFFRIV